jgi:hypothetical protein
MTEPFYAHSLPGKPPSEWQPLEEYLRSVAEMAELFAELFVVRIESPLPFAGEGQTKLPRPTGERSM